MKWFAGILALFSFSLATECQIFEGYASWYGGKFHGRKASSGEKFDKYKFTAASNHFEFHSYVLVRNLENGRAVVVRINDRGPFRKGRIIDLSKSAAEKLGMLKKGIAKVQVIPLHCVAEEEAEEMLADIIKTD